MNNANDFWPGVVGTNSSPFIETEAGATHVVITAPEPATGAFFLLGAALFVLRRTRISSAP